MERSPKLDFFLSEKTVVIYALKDPRTNEIRYVGKTKRIEQRFRDHLREAKSSKNITRKNNWIKHLLNQNLIPEISILEIVDENHWQNREMLYIKQHQSKNLTNMTSGGEGVKELTADGKAKLIASIKSRVISDQAKKNMSAAQKARVRTPEQKAAIAELIRKSNTGKKRSQETRERLRQSHLGKKQPEEQIEKRVAKLKGQKRTAEHKKVFSEIAKKRAPEIMENLRLHNIGTKRTEEQKERIRQGIKNSTKRKHRKENTNG